jgi:hypothetical protein
VCVCLCDDWRVWRWGLGVGPWVQCLLQLLPNLLAPDCWVLFVTPPFLCCRRRRGWMREAATGTGALMRCPRPGTVALPTPPTSGTGPHSPHLVSPTLPVLLTTLRLHAGRRGSPLLYPPSPPLSHRPSLPRRLSRPRLVRIAPPPHQRLRLQRCRVLYHGNLCCVLPPPTPPWTSQGPDVRGGRHSWWQARVR